MGCLEQMLVRWIESLFNNCKDIFIGHPATGKPEFEETDPRCKVSLTKLDPRLHFALNCGARSCPPIRIYTEERINSQLEMATESFLSQEVNVVAKEANKWEVVMSKLF